MDSDHFSGMKVVARELTNGKAYYMKRSGTWFCLTCSVAVIAGCATSPDPYQSSKPQPVKPVAPVVQTVPAPEPVPALTVVPELSASQKALVEAVANFDQGNYPLARRQLIPLTTDTSLSVPERIKALKILAFSQCLTRAAVACRRTFERAFLLDPDFDLASTEQGHPVWGKQFLAAQKRAKK